MWRGVLTATVSGLGACVYKVSGSSLTELLSRVFSLTLFLYNITSSKQANTNKLSLHSHKTNTQSTMVAFLELTSAVSQPFVIPSLSPVSQPSSRKNSDVSADDLNLAIANAALLGAAAPNNAHPRKNSLTLL